MEDTSCADTRPWICKKLAEKQYTIGESSYTLPQLKVANSPDQYCNSARWTFSIRLLQNDVEINREIVELDTRTLTISTSEVTFVGAYTIEVNAVHNQAENVGNPNPIQKSFDLRLLKADCSDSVIQEYTTETYSYELNGTKLTASPIEVVGSENAECTTAKWTFSYQA